MRHFFLLLPFVSPLVFGLPPFKRALLIYLLALFFCMIIYWFI